MGTLNVIIKGQILRSPHPVIIKDFNVSTPCHVIQRLLRDRRLDDGNPTQIWKMTSAKAGILPIFHGCSLEWNGIHDGDTVTLVLISVDDPLDS